MELGHLIEGRRQRAHLGSTAVLIPTPDEARAAASVHAEARRQELAHPGERVCP
jgi:hypothetical protein